ncbi:hypothetical protein Mapa_010244 [Marchantia paleacea]|nr:hypothetical protein Mapa_010244 [Marchantia paleacea]
MGEACSEKSGLKHALVFPVPLQAHISSAYRLSLELAKRGCTITFLTHDKHIGFFEKLAEPRQYDYHMAYYPALEENVGKNAEQFVQKIQDNAQPTFDKLVADQRAGLPVPTCIIADRFISWVKDVAQAMKIPYYIFFSNGGTYARFMQAQPELFANGSLSFNEGSGRMSEFQGSIHVPGIPPLRYRDLPLFARHHLRLSLRMSEAIIHADGLIVNTFYDLEARALDAMQEAQTKSSVQKRQRLFLVGPLAYVSTFKSIGFEAQAGNHGANSLEWLDSRPPKSVLYICLGTYVFLKPEQILELASALETCEQNFLWILSLENGKNAKLEDVLPHGYEARMKGKGLIVTGWVPQVQILAHPSVGGFLTHCGWSSLSEGVCCAVPMLAWPQDHEQFVNNKAVVDVLKVALPVWKGDEETVDREQFVKVIQLLWGEEREEMRTKVRDLQLKAKAAFAEGGSSWKGLDEVVECIAGRSR